MVLEKIDFFIYIEQYVLCAVMIGLRFVKIRVIAVLLGVVVIIAAGLGIAYALKKKHILLVVTTTSDIKHATETEVVEIRLKRDKDGGNIFKGTIEEDGEMTEVTLMKASSEEGGDETWLLSSDNKLLATLSTQPENGVFSFLSYDPPASNTQEWTSLLKNQGRRYSFSHSWY